MGKKPDRDVADLTADTIEVGVKVVDGVISGLAKLLAGSNKKGRRK